MNEPQSLEQYYSDYKWIKVKRHQDDENLSWEERYKILEEHHLKETTFLIEQIRKLAKNADGLLIGPLGSSIRLDKVNYSNGIIEEKQLPSSIDD